MKMILYCSIAFFVILELFPGEMVQAFLGDNLSEEALRVGRAYIRFDGFCIGILGAKMAADGTLRGMADTAASTVANLVNLAIHIAASFAFAPVFGIPVVWYASPLGWAANWLISGLRLRKTGPFRKKVR